MIRSSPVVPVISIDRRGRARGILDDGRTALIDDALPGDLLRLDSWFGVGDLLRSASWTMLESSPERREPPCLAADRCRGCRLMPLNELAQREVKLERVRRALSPLLPDQSPESIEIGWIEAPSTLGYRNSVRMSVDEGHALFFNPNKTFECPVLEPSLRKMVHWIHDRSLEDVALLSPYAHLKLRAMDTMGHAGLLLSPRDPATSDSPSFGNDAGAPADMLVECLGQKPQSQRFKLTEGAWLEVPLRSFLQINTSVNEALVEHLVEGALKRSCETFVDLFCGAGNLSVPLLSEGLRGVCIDYDEAAVMSLMRSVERIGIAQRQLQATVGDVTSQVSRLCDEKHLFDLVIVDPPRKGVGSALSCATELAGRYIAMISCEPETLSRDLFALAEDGFFIEQVTAFDMFPQTHHVEVVIWLRKTNSARNIPH